MKPHDQDLLDAAARGDLPGVRDALAAGANTGARDRHRRTALLLAVLGDHVAVAEEIVALLLAAGADPALADADGVTAFEHALRRGFEAIARRIAAALRQSSDGSGGG